MRIKTSQWALLVLWLCAALSMAMGLMVNAQETKPATPPVTEEKKVTEIQMLKAQIIKLQLQYLEGQKSLASCQQEAVAGTARMHEEEILKSIDAKPGQKFDWNTMTVTPVPPQPAKPEKLEKP